MYWLLLLLLLFPSYSSADWQSDLEAQFDIVETFDQLADWTPTNHGGSSIDQADMPNKINESDSIWNMYDNYHDDDPVVTVIGSHGEGNAWQGTKSLVMDLDQVNADPISGVQRFGFYFGSDTEDVADAYTNSGLKNSGYEEVYYFYMVKFPSNAFPTDNEQPYPSGDYESFGYYKFGVIATGFTAINTMPDGGRDPYGRGNSNNNWKYCSSYCGASTDSISIRVNWYLSNADGDTVDQTIGSGSTGWGQNGGINSYMQNNEWFGYEVRQKKNTNGNADGIYTIWIYDEDGVATEVYDNQAVELVDSGLDHNFNKFFFGGNLSTADWYSSLDTTYYIDDFIMDSDRIGPTYFGMLGESGGSSSPIGGASSLGNVGTGASSITFN